MEPVYRIIFYHMISIFHGDDQVGSRQDYLRLIAELSKNDVLHLDSKNINLDQINGYLNGPSMFGDTKAIAIDNFFSIPKANLDKLSKMLNQTSIDVFLWQDKALNATQAKVFPKAKYYLSKSENLIYTCINTIKPGNLINFLKIYDQIIDQEQFDLLLWMLKGSFRRQLQSYSKLDLDRLKKAYLQTIELEFQYKSGQLSLPKDIALKRVMVNLLK